MILSRLASSNSKPVANRALRLKALPYVWLWLYVCASAPGGTITWQSTKSPPICLTKYRWGSMVTKTDSLSDAMFNALAQRTANNEK
jgi:hypothetical protein